MGGGLYDGYHSALKEQNCLHINYPAGLKNILPENGTT